MCLQLAVFGGEQTRVELDEHQEALRCRVVVASVVAEVNFAHLIHGAVGVGQELCRGLQDRLLRDVEVGMELDMEK